MHRTTSTLAAAFATAVLTLSGGAVLNGAQAAGHEHVACAQQQKQVTKAEDALARVTAVFERQKAKVKHAREEVAAADTRSEKARAKAHLEAAKEKKAHALKEKKAQQKRLEKAEARLAACQAEQPTP